MREISRSSDSASSNTMVWYMTGFLASSLSPGEGKDGAFSASMDKRQLACRGAYRAPSRRRKHLTDGSLHRVVSGERGLAFRADRRLYHGRAVVGQSSEGQR